MFKEVKARDESNSKSDRKPTTGKMSGRASGLEMSVATSFCSCLREKLFTIKVAIVNPMRKKEAAAAFFGMTIAYWLTSEVYPQRRHVVRSQRIDRERTASTPKYIPHFVNLRDVCLHLSQSHGDRRLAGPRLAREQDGASRYLSFLDHLVDHARCPPRPVLAHETLAHVSRLERVVEPEATDVAMRPDPLDTGEVAHFRASQGDIRRLHPNQTRTTGQGRRIMSTLSVLLYPWKFLLYI